jgi:outer membrane protein, heavy metal efflux system
VRLSAVVVLSMLMAGSAGAQVVSEREFLAGIIEGHPALASTTQPLAEAQAAVERARVLSNPIVEAIREDPQEVARQTTLTLSWTLPIDGRRGLGIDAAEAGLAAAEKQIASLRLQLKLEARAVYAQWAVATALERVLGDEVRGVTDLARRVRARAEAGEESALAAGRLDLAAADVRAEQRAAAASGVVASAVARVWRPDLPPGAVPDLPALGGPQELAAPIVLEGLQKETERARLQERLAGRYWTAPALQAGWQRQHYNDASGPVFGLSWTIPIFDRNQGSRHAAQRRRELAEARLAWTTVRVVAAVEGRRAALNVERQALEEAERAAALAAPVVKAATARFEAGEGTVTELVEAIAAARMAQRRSVEVRARALAAERALVAAEAGLIEGELR